MDITGESCGALRLDDLICDIRLDSIHAHRLRSLAVTYAPLALLLSVNAFRICRDAHYCVARQSPPFPMPASVKAPAGGFLPPPHVALSFNARRNRGRKPRKPLDDLTHKYRHRWICIHVVEGHDDFLRSIVVYPEVHSCVAETRSGRQ